METLPRPWQKLFDCPWYGMVTCMRRLAAGSLIGMIRLFGVLAVASTCGMVMYGVGILPRFPQKWQAGKPCDHVNDS